MSASARTDPGKIHVITAARESEPQPVWKHAPRHLPHIALPPYRHVPGVTPHLARDEEGHSYGLSMLIGADVTAQNWKQNCVYLRGIDLYHQGYLWEAHEAWEGPWREAEPDSLEANLLQALILNSAALLKIHIGNAAGARKHSQAARWRLARVRTKGFDGPEARFLGMHIADFIEQIKRYYGPMWETADSGEIRVRGRAPRIDLEMSGD